MRYKTLMSNVYEFRQQVKQSEYVCSACGADRGCACNAPALERELARKATRSASNRRAYNAKKSNENNERQHAESNPAADRAEAPCEFGIPQDAHKRSFLERAELAGEFAEFDGEVDDEIRTAARKTANMWLAVANRGVKNA